MTVVLSAIRRDLRLALLRPTGLVLDALGIVVGVALIFFIGRFVGSGSNGVPYFAYAATGLPVLRMHGAVGRVLAALGIGTVSGTFEHAVSSPAPVPVVVLAELAFELLRAAVIALLLLAVAALYGAPFALSVGGAVGVLLGIVGAAGVFAALGALVIGLVQVVREASSVVALTALVLPVLAGAYFPLSTLPAPIEAVATVLPFRLPVDLLRAGLVDGTLDVGAAALLAASLAVALPLGLAAAAAGVAHARRRGALGSA
ncbi:ABC transporter permease [Patulibacter sp. SYSU D01012]|uniref:ABC transporter permease n=1 Tax=Patulibacter sp. SYSU D01012 TaxID=2817381 RepID=UPI001B3004CB|nr:ABC transporter permease [Patulibacter sp. SYSU D01012]